MLTSLRYLGTVVANVLIYAVTWLFFGLEGGNNEISSKDSEKFRYNFRKNNSLLNFNGFLLFIFINEIEVNITHNPGPFISISTVGTFYLRIITKLYLSLSPFSLQPLPGYDYHAGYQIQI